MARLRDIARFPVFVDLVYERHRSSVIAAITVLRFLKALYLLVVLNSQINLSRSCLDFVEDASNLQAETDISDIMEGIFVLGAALASCKANSFIWAFVAALPAGVIYLGLFGRYEYAACASLIRAATGDPDAIARVIDRTFDLVLSVATIAMLLWIIASDYGFVGRVSGVGPTTSKQEASELELGDAYASQDGNIISSSMSGENDLTERLTASDNDAPFSVPVPDGAHSPPAQLPTAGSVSADDHIASGSVNIKAWIGKAVKGAKIAPLRHHIASVLAFFFCLAVTIVMCIMGPILAERLVFGFWNPAVDMFNSLVDEEVALGPTIDQYPPTVQTFFNVATSFTNKLADLINTYGIMFVNSLIDMLFSLYISSALSCCTVIVSMSASYVYIYEDHCRLDDAIPGRGRKNKAASDEPRLTVEEAQQLTARPDEPPLPSRFACCCRGTRPRTFLPGTETPDVTSDAFSYFSAFNYSSLYAINIITSWVLLTALFGAVIFLFVSDLTHEWAMGLVYVFVGSWIYNKLLAFAFRSCVARGNSVLRPRVLLLADLIFSMTLGAAAGLTAGVVRFMFGMVALIFRLTLLARPILPGFLATYDSGFMSYAGMTKASWAGRLSPGSEPEEPTR